MAIITEAEWKTLLKKPLLKGVSATGISEQLRNWEKAVKDKKDLATKQKILEKLVKVIEENKKEYGSSAEFVGK